MRLRPDKMGCREVIVSLLLINTFSLSLQSPLEPFFRKDYEFVSRQEGFFKLHRIPTTWNNAMATCFMESSELAFPLTTGEAELLTSFLTQRLDNDTNGLWVGAHDLFAEGVYVSLGGVDVEKLYSSWSPGEPNDASNNEDCLMLTRSGNLNDIGCSSRFPFICKKEISRLTTNAACETYDMGYELNGDKTRCYKIHTTRKTWFDAYATCHAELSYLVIINNEKEAKDLEKMLAEKKIITHECISVGFHDLFKEGEYLTIHGQALNEVGYMSWDNGQPDNAKGGEHCGCLKLNGRLNDYNCSIPIYFICERDLGDPNVVELYSRLNMQ